MIFICFHHNYVDYIKPLKCYVCLRLVRVEKSQSSTEDHIPFILSRLVGHYCHVGPEGATIGTSKDCSVCVPSESEVWPAHAEICWSDCEFTSIVLTMLTVR